MRNVRVKTFEQRQEISWPCCEHFHPSLMALRLADFLIFFTLALWWCKISGAPILHILGWQCELPKAEINGQAKPEWIHNLQNNLVTSRYKPILIRNTTFWIMMLYVYCNWTRPFSWPSQTMSRKNDSIKTRATSWRNADFTRTKLFKSSGKRVYDGHRMDRLQVM